MVEIGVLVLAVLGIRGNLAAFCIFSGENLKTVSFTYLRMISFIDCISSIMLASPYSLIFRQFSAAVLQYKLLPFLHNF